MNLICPHCKSSCTITSEDIRKASTWIKRKHQGNEAYAINVSLITCPNWHCGKIIAFASLITGTGMTDHGGHIVLSGSSTLANKQIYPEVQPNLMEIPEYVPSAIKNDYIEAFKIKNLSPKASATLARRCLQGMIRDFWGIKKARLIDEINDLADKIDPTTWEAVDSLRKLGNIGAHMGKDVNLIIDIDPNEAELLIKLIENLIEDWYIARHNREERKKQIIALASKKSLNKKVQETTK